MLRRKGTLISVGNASGAVEPFAPIKLVEKNLKLLRPTYVSSYGVILFLWAHDSFSMTNYTVTPDEVYHYGHKVYDLILKRVFKINIFKEYPFTTEGVRDAQKDLATRSGVTVGKLLIKV
jgi:NADPH:quinone reductase